MTAPKITITKDTEDLFSIQSVQKTPSRFDPENEEIEFKWAQAVRYTLKDERSIYIVSANDQGKITAFLRSENAVALCHALLDKPYQGDTHVAFVHESLASAFERKIATYNRRAVKLGQEPLSTSSLGIHVVKKTKTNEISGQKTTTVTEHAVLLVVGKLPRIEGWTFLGAIDRLPTESGGDVALVRSAPGAVIPKSEIDRPLGTCDHCKTNRKRQTTYVLKSDANGETQQVGSSCVADFIRSTSAAVLSLYGELREICEMGGDPDEDCEERGPRGKVYFHLDEVLTAAIATIKLNGWLSATKAKESFDFTPSTKTLVSGWLYKGPLSNPTEKERKEREEMSAEVAAAVASGEVEAAIAWCAALTDDEVYKGDSNYLLNLRTLAQAGLVPDKGIGIAVSIIPTYRRAIGKEIERKARAEVNASSVFVGQVKERREFVAVLEWFREFDGQYGVTTLYKFRTTAEDASGAGNVLVWFASTSLGDDEVIQGSTFKLKGTIKKHEDRDGVKQTVITRCAADRVASDPVVSGD